MHPDKVSDVYVIDDGKLSRRYTEENDNSSIVCGKTLLQNHFSMNITW